MPNADATTETQSGPHPERQFAEACRAAGLAFLEGTRAGWGKRELVAWLVGPYRELSAQVGTESMPPPSMQSAQNAIREETLDELLHLVRVAVSSALADLLRGDTTCVTESIRERSILEGGERDGVWLPADRPRMRLEARVLSLFVVDYLHSARPYEADLAVCTDCDAVNFDGAGRRCPDCGQPSQTRSIVPSPVVLAATS